MFHAYEFVPKVVLILPSPRKSDRLYCILSDDLAAPYTMCTLLMP